jgi:hypothetical protein
MPSSAEVLSNTLCFDQIAKLKKDLTRFPRVWRRRVVAESARAPDVPGSVPNPGPGEAVMVSLIFIVCLAATPEICREEQPPATWRAPCLAPPRASSLRCNGSTII